MRFVGCREWDISALEKDIHLEGTHYVCPSKDEETNFPPDEKFGLRQPLERRSHASNGSEYFAQRRAFLDYARFQ